MELALCGAFGGDIAGSRFEFHPTKSKKFTLFTDGCRVTDDSVLTMAVAEAILDAESGGDLADCTVKRLREYGRRFPDAGYGGRFRAWLRSDDPQPYGSFGNGSGMRAAPCGLYAATLEEAQRLAEVTAAVTHSHPDGIAGAQAVAGAVYLAKQGLEKDDIRTEAACYYRLGETVDEIRPYYDFDVSCRGSVPQAIQCFLESESWEDAVRNAISLGGDADTQACMAGAIAWPYYVRRGWDPAPVQAQIRPFLPAPWPALLEKFEEACLRHARQQH